MVEKTGRFFVPIFEGFEERSIVTSDVTIQAWIGGSGPPLLLLHGYPQTHVMWHKIAPTLARRFTVVATDLRGYGKSQKPAGGEAHENFSKRAMAKDQVEVMRKLGFDRFSVVAHDRGARVAHRMALDHDDVVEKLVLLDIAPTDTMYGATDKAFATAYYHWFFLIQPYDLPERLINSDPGYYLRKTLNAWCKTPDSFPEEVMEEYIGAFSDPAAIHSACEDYRAAAGIDLKHDAEDGQRRVSQPLLVLWGERGVVGNSFDVLGVWKTRADKVEGEPLPCGHFLAEEVPELLMERLDRFL
ncbi:alpha/beta hydrolase [Rhizobium mesosinicum]|uniref:Alpha/beta hydrolase n=2 Tax=Rhizobium mesosinicum TaxID=335017 RepID=A0ABS7GMZ0_9HYPH|nr:alpha/beta hydrolase [Rhizobium mesosinicum]